MKKFKIDLRMFDNTITTSLKYLEILDEIYQASAKTMVLDAPSGFVAAGRTAGTVYLSKIAMDGLGDYSRNGGHVGGDVTFDWESHTLTQDRGRSFQVDVMDDVETFDQAFGRLAGEFIRTKVVPEIDAYRISKMAGLAGNSAEATLTASTIDTALETATLTMDEAEVPMEQRVLFVTPTVASLIRQSDNYVRNINAAQAGTIDNRIGSYNGMPVVEIPQKRMYTAITLYDGTTGGQTAGGYIKNVATGKDVNFMMVHAPAVLGVTKHIAPRIFTPEVNQSANAYKFDYRIYHDLFVPDNKTNGVYLHNKAA